MGEDDALDGFYAPDDDDLSEVLEAGFDGFCQRAANLPPKDRPAAKDRVLERLAGDRKLTSAALAIAVTLLIDLMWQRGCVDRLGFADLAQRTGRSRSTIMRAVRLLEKRGHITVDRNRLSPKTNEINRYTFLHFFS